MESDSNNKSIVDEYLSENRGEAQKSVRMNSPSLSPASAGKRIGAFLVDKIILFIVGIYILSPLVKPTEGFNMIPFFTNIITEFLYAGYFYSSQMATPGKMVFGLQVVKDSGEKLDFLKGGLRDSLGKSISSIILGIGYLMAFFRSDRSALHDLMFKTRVVEKS